VADVVVIGANGFLGSHLVDGLVREGHNVTAFGRFRSDEPAFTSRDVRIVRGEFLSRADLEVALEGSPDHVFHFLSTTTPASAQGDPLLDLRTNVDQSVELMQLCVEAGVGRLFFASTGGAIYGAQGRYEYREDDRPQPVSPYAIGKLAIEHYLRYFDVVHGLHSTALRISNPYGPRQPPHRRQGLIPIALQQVILDAPITRFGDGGMVRDYLYVRDLIEMILRMVPTAPRSDVYNLGSGVGHTVTEVLEAVRRATGVDFAIIEKEVPATFVDRVVLDIDRYRAEYGDVELTPLDEGVRLTYQELNPDGR
jgi:UDP-glucose 4-epimerase